MPTLRQDSSLSEFTFTPQEELQGKVLNSLQIMWLQTRFAQLFKEKASSLIPEDGAMDRSFFLLMGNIQGKLDMLQEIFDDARMAKVELENRGQNISGNGEVVSSSLVEIQNVADRASAQVHQM